MLEFNSEQQRAFDRAAQRREAQRLTPIMRRNFTDILAQWNDASLEDAIADALNTAAQLGVKTRTASTDFVILTLLLGPHFHGEPGVAHLFVAQGADIDARVRLLMSEFKWQLGQLEGGE